MSQRHRLTITVSMPLYEELCRLAGSRGISRWMEDAAWHKIHACGRGESPASETAEVETHPRPGLPPPPWCWSPLRPAGPERGGIN